MGCIPSFSYHDAARDENASSSSSSSSAMSTTKGNLFNDNGSAGLHPWALWICAGCPVLTRFAVGLGWSMEALATLPRVPRVPSEPSSHEAAHPRQG